MPFFLFAGAIAHGITSQLEYKCQLGLIVDTPTNKSKKKDWQVQLFIHLSLGRLTWKDAFA
jgi:hypothetical protein